MTTYVISRLLQSVVVVWGVVTIVFVIMNLTGDPARLLLPQEASEQDIQDFRRETGLDRPLPEQYVLYIGRAVRADFGESLWQRGRKAMDLVVERYPATVSLALTALLITLAIAVPLGIVSALKPYSGVDNLAMMVALLGQSMPNFWLGIMLILLFAVSLQLLPSQGNGADAHLILPALTLAAPGIARITRVTRSQMLDVLGEQYILTARSKGLPEKLVIFKHALKNASIPLVTIVGLDIGNLLSGAIVVETVFAWRGVGSLAIQAIQKLDFPLVMADVFAIACSFVLVNLVVDLLYGVLDPRIRLA